MVTKDHKGISYNKWSVPCFSLDSTL